MNAEAERLIEEMDAALFSGDTFLSEEALQKLEEHLPRWQRHILELRDLLKNP